MTVPPNVTGTAGPVLPPAVPGGAGPILDPLAAPVPAEPALEPLAKQTLTKVRPAVIWALVLLTLGGTMAVVVPLAYSLTVRLATLAPGVRRDSR